jgi:hypothetical protein
MAEGKLQRDPTTGKIKRSLTNGKLVRNSSSSAACCCDAEPCDYYRARRCCDDAYVDFALAAAELPQLPYTFTYNDPSGQECWYVNSGSQCVPSTAYPIISIEDVTEYDDCDDCRGTCVECESETACNCCDMCDNDTPDEFTVTISTSSSSACSSELIACTAGDFYFKISSGSYSGGTYTLTQSVACAWVSSSFAGPTVSIYSDSGCTDLVGEVATTYSVALSCVADTWQVNVVSPADVLGCGVVILFQSIGISPFDCCGRSFGSNSTTAGTTSEDGEMFVTSGGQAVITPC